MPNLNQFNIAYSTHRMQYLEYLSETNDNQRHLAQLQQLLFSNVDRTDVLERENYYELAFKASLNYRASLEELILPRYQGHLYTQGDQTGDALHFLPSFRMLKRLTMKNTDDRSLTLFDMLPIIPDSMSHFNFQSILPPSTPSTVYQQILSVLDVSNKFSFIKSVNLEIRTLSRDYVQYLTATALPDSLDDIYIKLANTRFDSWMEDMGERTIYELATQLSKVKEVELTAACSQRVQPQQQRSSQAKMTAFYSLLHGIMGKRALSHCESTIYKGDLNGIMHIRIDNGAVDFSYSIYEQQQHQEDIPLPDTSISGMVHGIINQLTFINNGIAGNHIPIRLFEFCSTNCPYRHYLRFSFSSASLDVYTINHINQYLFPKKLVITK
jgi:hypothetical protein